MTTTSSFMSTVLAEGATSRSLTVPSWLMAVSSGALLARSYPGLRLLRRRALRIERDERLAFLDDVRGEFRGVPGADVLRRVDRSGRDEQGLPGPQRHWRPPLKLVFQQAFDHVGDLLARMAVQGERYAGSEIDAHLDDLASRDAEIVPQQIGALGSWLLRLCHVQRQAASDGKHRYHQNSGRFHVDLLRLPSGTLVVSVRAEVI